MKRTRLSLTGIGFGRWLVTGFAGLTTRGASMWDCVCICGNTGKVIGSSLIRGSSLSCGCLRSELTSSREKLDVIPIPVRFFSKVNKAGPMPNNPELGNCWVWTGSTVRYGRFRLKVGDKFQTEGAHRVAWFIETGEFPKQYILHKCDNTLCVRFSHLFQGTQGDNVKDMIAKGRHKKRGAVCTT
jgi:hypothetical protein